MVQPFSKARRFCKIHAAILKKIVLGILFLGKVTLCERGGGERQAEHPEKHSWLCHTERGSDVGDSHVSG